jgi:FtsP/CotA-like multicopper oxidase with cupredoxin domain
MARRLSRRDFLHLSGRSVALAGIGSRAPSLLGRAGLFAGSEDGWNPLRRMAEVAPRDLTLVARVGTADIGGGATSPAWMINGSLPSPLIRVRQGDPFSVTLRNELPSMEPLILHWHGITPPEHSDGHPRLAVASGDEYRYGFTVQNRAGTYWYHSHAHMRVAKHTALGIGGLFIVEDDEERALGLPSGEREIALIIQDKKLDRNGHLQYEDPILMGGQTGAEPFVNGVRRPYVEVDSALHRFRILNGSNARIFRLELSDGRPMVLLGNDSGLIDRAVSLTAIDIAPAERIDVLIDFSGARAGERIVLRSSEFTIPGRDVIAGVTNQGAPLDLMQIRVTREVQEPVTLPDRLCTVPGPDAAASVRERTFRFTTDSDPASRGTIIRHRINEQTFDHTMMHHADHQVPFGDTEIWTFKNDLMFAHEVHLHATHFRVLSRSGGRGQVMPWEAGVKDTVLIHPDESVRVAVRFTAHKGLFLLHCHNLEHEDVGMMTNIEVV